MQAPRSIAISGASDGIGSALARAYAGPGVTLALTGRNADRLEAVAAACRAAGAQVRSVALEITDEAAVRSWMESMERLAPLDLVIANAGMTGGPASSEAFESSADVRRMMGVNFEGVCNTIHPAIPAMLGRGRGQLALMSSLAALRGLPYSPAYCASKAALQVYGDALRARLRPRGVDVSVILAGFVDTKLSRHVRGPKPLLMTADRAAKVIRKGLLRRRSLIAFPFALHAGTRLLAALPNAVADRFLNRVKVAIRRYD